MRWHTIVLALTLPALGAAQASRPGLPTITTEGILADLRYVACADMGGRATPSVGQRLTARFLQNRLERLGWRPGANGEWLMRYPLEQRALDPDACTARVRCGNRTLDLTLADDYSFPPLSITSHELDGGVVWLGKAPDAGLDPRARAALRGRWAWAGEKGGELDALDPALRAAGAIGVLCTVEVLNTGGDPQARAVFKRFDEMMRAGVVSWPSKAPVLPRLYLPKKTTDTLRGMMGAAPPVVGDVLPVTFAETRRAAQDETIQAENVVGLWPGSDPARVHDLVLVSAHYDHLGVDARGRVWPGADDNGSGVVALLALADALAAHGPLRYSLLLVWTSGEEKGLWGAQAFVEQPCLPRGDKVVANINLDMVGRNAGDQLSLTPFAASHPAFSGLAQRAAQRARGAGFTQLRSADEYFHRSDNFQFARLGIPVLSLFDDMTADYHQPGDTVDKIDGDKIRRVTRMVFELLCDLDPDPAARAR